MKKAVFLLLALSMFFSLPTVAFAADSSPATPVTQFPGDESEYNPIGELTDEECQELLATDTGVMPMHFNLLPHLHDITSILSRYKGQRNRGVVAQTVQRVNTTSQLSYSKERSVSNSFSVSIGFEKSIVSGSLGYDVTFSTSDTASYTLDIPANKMGSITLYDMYDVTTFNARTTYILSSMPPSYGYEYGTGWAEQWTHFGFAGSIW
jgi:hypothetical protein